MQVVSPPPRSSPIHVATVNVRFDGQRSNPVPIPESGVVNPSAPVSDPWREQAWAVRRSRLVDALLSMGDLDIVGFQEVYDSQLTDIAELLGPAWQHVGVGRDDGKLAGEYSPIFYNAKRFERVHWKTLWLSPTPEKPGSVGWDASQTRIATMLSLRDRTTHGLVHAVCTHYDDRGRTARCKSSILVRSYVRWWVDTIERRLQPDSKVRYPVFLLGDFNSPPEEEGYKAITSYEPLPAASFTFLDAYTNLLQRAPGIYAQSRPYGPKATYTGFAAPGQERDTKRIDFVMMAADEGAGLADQKTPVPRMPTVGRGGWAARQYACVDNWVEEGDADGWRGRWSDHRAVRVTFCQA